MRTHYLALLMLIQVNNKLCVQEQISEATNEKWLEVYETADKGRGVRARKPFAIGEFIIEYRGINYYITFNSTPCLSGELIDGNEAKNRETIYAKNVTIGSYMFYFIYNYKSYCIDATGETIYKGRLVNHSHLSPNARVDVIYFNDTLHLALFATSNINVGDEILYDYGDKRKSVLISNPWLLTS